MQNQTTKISDARIGESLVFSAAVFASLLPVLVNPQSTALSPLWISAFSALLAILPISLVMIKKNCWSELKNRPGVFYSALAGIIIGVLYYSLIHWGCYHTSPQNASILGCFEMFTAMFMLRNRSNERLNLREGLGSSLLFLAMTLVFFPERTEPQSGDIAILLASFVSPIGNSFMKVARRTISSATIMWIRTIISTIILTSIGLVFSELPSQTEILESSKVLLVNGILILGISKILWVEGIYRIPIAKASALVTITPLLTFFFAWLILDKYPTLYQLLALPPTIMGVLLIITKKKLHKKEFIKC